MLKRIIFIIIAVILCDTASVAQDIPAEKVDYVIGYYVKAYIEKKTDKNIRSKFIGEDYTKLENNSFESPISQNDLENIIKKLPDEKLKNDKGKENQEIIKDKVGVFYDNIKNKRSSNDLSIDYIVELERGYENFLSGKSKSLKEELKNKIQEKGTIEAQVAQVVKADNTTTPKTENKRDRNRETTTTDKDKESSNSSLWWFWLLLGLGGGIFVWGKWLRVKIQPLFNCKETQSNQDYIKQLQDDKQELKSKIEELNKKISTLKKQNNGFLEENIAMGQKIEGLQYKPKQSYIADVHKLQGVVGQTRNDGQNDIRTTSASTLYADAITDGYFSCVKEMPNEDSVFELYLQNAQTATFTIYQSAYQRTIANPSFLEGCDKQVLNSAQKVEIVSKGTAQRDADGKWKISHKLNVIIR
jgi:hypothetical protein